MNVIANVGLTIVKYLKMKILKPKECRLSQSNIERTARTHW